MSQDLSHAFHDFTEFYVSVSSQENPVVAMLNLFYYL